VNAYVDASVLLRVVFPEAGGLAGWERITRPISSELIRVECLRAIERARLTFRLEDEVLAPRRSAVLELLTGFDLVPISPAILERAAEPFPTAIGTLDAIHLATALDVRAQRDLSLVATHDQQLGTAATAVGFTVEGV